ncbi:hypothetical protein COY07_06180 [Candidatus Peregrinibacteria bacterium CG_4_10_14_0_2_um_filter_43_11]|nr:MAG: hypothetical protein COY07_06180 [Candidatus Peregrinibacteria bacterium CG_4_10_14_0_2_um_filter_43_11]
MKNYNQALSKIFQEIADLMGILGENSFKVQAYRKIARRLTEEIPLLTGKDFRKQKLKEIPGVGDAIAGKMLEYAESGEIGLLKKLQRQIPKAVRELLQIPHLGPDRVRKLFLNLHIRSKQDLVKAAKNGKIAMLSGFGEKLTDQILEALKTGQQKKKRHQRAEVEPVIQQLTDELLKIKGVEQVIAAGSYRRGADDVGDVDLLIVGSQNSASEAEKQIQKLFKKITFLANGSTKIAFVIFPQNLQIDIRFVPQESAGSALLYFTGSKEFNVKMRKVAIGKSFLLNEYGLFKDGEYIAGKTEKEVFKSLGMKYVEPNERV